MAKKVLTPEELAARKAQQSKTGKSNVRRSKSHERTIAKFLTTWSGQEFRRRRVEGRDVTVIERESTADVIPVKGDIHCSIEAKCGSVQTFAALMNNPKGTKFTEWWHQACYDVTLVSKVFNRQFYPMMFFRPYPNQNWVAISDKLFSQGILKPHEHLTPDLRVENTGGKMTLSVPLVWFPHFHFDAYDRLGEVSFNVVRTNNPKNYKFVPLVLDSMVLCRWQDFAAHVDPRSFFLNHIPLPADSANQSYDEDSESPPDGGSFSEPNVGLVE